MGAFVEVTTTDGEKIMVNAAQVVKLRPIVAKEATETQPPKHTTELTFAGGAKKEMVEGRMQNVVRTLDGGLR